MVVASYINMYGRSMKTNGWDGSTNLADFFPVLFGGFNYEKIKFTIYMKNNRLDFSEEWLN